MANNIGVRNLKNCTALIFDNDNNYKVEATIIEHDKNEMSIAISEKLDNVKRGTRLNLLIIHSGDVIEFRGTLIGMRNGMSEITLFNERNRKARAAVRHKINASAVINNLIAETGQKPFDPPLKVMIENISATGALVKSPPGHFGINSILELSVNIHGKDVVLYGAVVREQENADNTVSYGCKLVFLK